jgi:VWFA-related protein
MDYPGKTSPNDPDKRERRADDSVMQNPGTSAKDYEVAGRYLMELADRTGGRVYRADNPVDLGSAFESIAKELRQQYSVGYYPPNLEKSGVPRKIKVKVTRPNLVVKARETYTIGESTKKKR